MKPETRNVLIAAGVALVGTTVGLLWVPLLLVPGGLGLIGVGWFGDEWRIQRQGGAE